MVHLADVHGFASYAICCQGQMGRILKWLRSAPLRGRLSLLTPEDLEGFIRHRRAVTLYVVTLYAVTLYPVRQETVLAALCTGM
jgi:hypothetical protein